MFDFNNKTILITGGAGFIGSNLAFHLQDNYPLSNIVIFDLFQSKSKFESGNLTALGHFKNLIGFNGQVICGDITSQHDLSRLDSFNWDCIFHQAAISDTTVEDQSSIIKTNTNTLPYFVNLALKSNAHLVYASSAGVYGNSFAPNQIGLGEVPENVYGFSKLMMDNYTRNLICQDSSLKITGLRYFNVYGHREFYKGKTASMILQLGLQILARNRPRLFKYGEQARDFIFIEDVIQANIKAVGASSGIYNVGTGITRTFNDIVRLLGEVFNVSVEVDYFDNPYQFYQNNTCGDISEIESRLNYRPEYTLEQGIKVYASEILKIHESNN